MAAMNGGDFHLVACPVKSDEDTLTEVSSDVSSSFEKEISSDIVASPDSSCSPTSPDVGTTGGDETPNKESKNQPQKENQQESCQRGRTSMFSGEETMLERDIAVRKDSGKSMAVNRPTADSDIVLTRSPAQSFCKQTSSAVELLDMTATSEPSVSNRKYDWLKTCHFVERRSSGAFACSPKESDVGRVDKLTALAGLQERGAACVQPQPSLVKEIRQKIPVEAASSVCGHDFCCHRLARERARSDSRAATSKTESKQHQRMHTIHGSCSPVTAEYPVSDDGEVPKSRLLNGKGTALQQTLSDRRPSSVVEKVIRGVSLMGVELSPRMSVSASQRSLRDLSAGSSDILRSFSSSCSQEDKEFLVLPDRDRPEPLAQRCQKLHRNFSFSAEASAGRDRRHVLRRVCSMSDTSSTSSCFATGVPPAAGETLTSRLRFERNHQDHGQVRQEYLTPSQRKDLLIRELKQQVRHLTKALQDKDEETESWRAQMRAETMELMAAAQQETEEAKKMAALAEQEVTSLRASHEESVKMASSLQKLVDELKKNMVKRERETEGMLLEMFNKGRASAVFEREEELEMQAKNSKQDPQVKSTITDLRNKLVRTEAELARWQTLQRHESYYTAHAPATEAETTLSFLKDSMYHYLVAGSPKDADGHLRAVVRILQFSEAQKEKIAKTLIRQRNKSLTGLR